MNMTSFTVNIMSNGKVSSFSDFLAKLLSMFFPDSFSLGFLNSSLYYFGFLFYSNEFLFGTWYGFIVFLICIISFISFFDDTSHQSESVRFFFITLLFFIVFGLIFFITNEKLLLYVSIIFYPFFILYHFYFVVYLIFFSTFIKSLWKNLKMLFVYLGGYFISTSEHGTSGVSGTIVQDNTKPITPNSINPADLIPKNIFPSKLSSLPFVNHFIKGQIISSKEVVDATSDLLDSYSRFGEKSINSEIRKTELETMLLKAYRKLEEEKRLSSRKLANKELKEELKGCDWHASCHYAANGQSI